MAVLHQREGADDGVCCGWTRADDGCGGGRCRVCTSIESALHREHRRYGADVFGDVQDAALRGYFAGGVVGAYAGVAGGSAFGSGAGDVEEDCEGRGGSAAAVGRRDEISWRRFKSCGYGAQLLLW